MCEKDCPGGPVDLNDLVPEGWIVSEGFAINDAGEVLAIGAFGEGGLLGALLLRPVEPHLALLAPAPGEAGRRNRFEVRWAEPGAWVAVVRGDARGSTPVGLCGVDLEVAAPSIVGFARADAQGTAVVRRRIPAALADQPQILQALDLGRCETSAIHTQTF